MVLIEELSHAIGGRTPCCYWDGIEQQPNLPLAFSGGF
jgi:hypothetical protein